MTELIDQIATSLKAARKAKGLSQRALSERAGVPQSHISRIENGGVDLRVSSLVELTRALDLEVTLVPRKAVPAVKSIVRSVLGTGSTQLKASMSLGGEAQERPKPAL
jgi:transcriptional regulator with XRE-family HTH domain